MHSGYFNLWKCSHCLLGSSIWGLWVPQMQTLLQILISQIVITQTWQTRRKNIIFSAVFGNMKQHLNATTTEDITFIKHGLLRYFKGVFSLLNPFVVGRVAQSVWRLTTGWMVRDWNPVGTRFSARPDQGPTLLPVKWVPGVSPWVEAAGEWVWPPTPN